MLLVREVRGPGSAAAGTVAIYRCIRFNQDPPPDAEVKQINWAVLCDGRTVATFAARGPVLELAMPSDLAGRTLEIRPYRNTPTANVQATTRIAAAAAPPAGAPAPAPAPTPAQAPAPVPAPPPAPAAPSAAIDLKVTVHGNRYYAEGSGVPSFYVGTDVTYLKRRGLMSLEIQPGATVDFAEMQRRYGHWADIVAPTAVCESKGTYTCLNTYDTALFTFGAMQWAAHTPDANLVVLLRRLLQLPSGPVYFPDLALENGRIVRRSGGASQPLETAQSTKALQDYLNPTPDTVDAQEAENAAKLVHWALSDPQHRETQTQFAIDQARSAIADYARRYGLNGKTDDIVVVVFDIRHQGRAMSSQIESALSAGDPLQALLALGHDRFPDRCKTLTQEIDKAKSAGTLGRLVYDQASGDWVAPGRVQVT
jgi:hypothetical protein